MALSSTIMRLFANESDSPVSCASPHQWNGAFGTPYEKSSSEDIGAREIKAYSIATARNTVRSLFMDEDSGLGMETDVIEDQLDLSYVQAFVKNEENTTLNCSFTEILGNGQSTAFTCRSVKKASSTNKRLADTTEEYLELSPAVKIFRKDETNLLKFALTNSPSQTDDEVSCIIRAVDRLTTEVDLVADGSRDYSLQTVVGKHGDLKAISANTMADFIKDTENSGSDDMIIDCRYPYEFEGGHIKGAVNLYTKEHVHKLLELTETDRPRVLVFHCEFSSERGPKMYRFLRSCDRELNKDCYPKLNFPEVYLLEGGYKEFYNTQKAFCEPRDYKPMLHKDHGSDLRHFRVKSKSWSGGRQRKRLAKSRFTRSCLSFDN